MASVTETKIDSLPQYLEQFEPASRRPSQLFWYRGSGNLGYQLLPSLYRHKGKNTPESYSELERNLLTRFRQRSIPYHSRSLVDDWDALFFMQHYGVPTRLLDWTENPLIALHFALMGVKRRATLSKRPLFENSAAVWVLDPIAWNRHALKHLSFEGEVLTPNDEVLRRSTERISPDTEVFWNAQPTCSDLWCPQQY